MIILPKLTKSESQNLEITIEISRWENKISDLKKQLATKENKKVKLEETKQNLTNLVYIHNDSTAREQLETIHQELFAINQTMEELPAAIKAAEDELKKAIEQQKLIELNQKIQEFKKAQKDRGDRLSQINDIVEQIKTLFKEIIDLNQQICNIGKETGNVHSLAINDDLHFQILLSSIAYLLPRGRYFADYDALKQKDYLDRISAIKEPEIINTQFKTMEELAKQAKEYLQKAGVELSQEELEAAGL